MSRSLNVGDRVVLVGERYSTSESNPRAGGIYACGGVIEEVKSDTFRYEVKWDNDFQNQYQSGDLMHEPEYNERCQETAPEPAPEVNTQYPKLGEVESLEWGVVYRDHREGESLLICTRTTPDTDGDAEFATKEEGRTWRRVVDCIKKPVPAYVLPPVGALIRCTASMGCSLNPPYILRVDSIINDDTVIKPAVTGFDFVQQVGRYLIQPEYTILDLSADN